MSDRLVLSTVGIKQSVGGASEQRRAARAAAPRPGASSSRRPRRVLMPTPIISEGEDAAGEVPQVTTVRLDSDLARKLDGTARAAGVSPNQLAVATLERALSGANGAVRVQDQRRRNRSRTTNRKLHLPHHLRERADAISARTNQPRTGRSELINNAIRGSLPDNPRLALALVIVAATAARAPKP